MKTFEIEQSDTEFYSNHAGMALIGQLIANYSDLDRILSRIPLLHGISHADLAKCYLGLVCQGKNDFEAVRQLQGDEFFLEAMGIKNLASSERLRQRFDEKADVMTPLIDLSNQTFLEKGEVPVTPLDTGHVPLDIDVFPMDNSGTKKEGVSYTYKGHDGYAPIAAYLGEEGWNLACELREGSTHCQKGFIDLLNRVIPRAKALTEAPLLVRLDGGHDALDNRLYFKRCENTDYIIKWNPRKEDWVDWAKLADEKGVWYEEREGKDVAIFRVEKTVTVAKEEHSFQLIVKVVKRTMEPDGQLIGFTDGSIEGWWTSLNVSDKKVIALYENHATSEQFHSEIKTDLDLERLPSGKFNTNDLVLSFGSFAYNLLRYIGLKGLIGPHSPIKRSAKRRRVSTVIKELIYLACRYLKHRGRIKLRFSKHCPAYRSFLDLYGTLVGT